MKVSLLSNITINNYLSILEYSILTIAFFAYFFLGKHVKGSNRSVFDLLRWYILLEFGLFFSMRIMAHYLISNLFMSHVYFIGQFILLSLFYHKLLLSHQKKLVKWMAFVILVVLSVQFSIKPSYFKIFNPLEVAITSIPLIGYSIIHLYNQLIRPNSFVFVNVGVLMYISASCLIFLLGNYLSSLTLNMTIDIWLINKVLFIIYMSMYLIEWYYAGKSKSTHN